MRIAIPALLAAAATVHALQPASMRDAMDAALRNAPQVGEYDATLDGAKARSSGAIRAILPSAELFGSHAETFTGSPPNLDSPASRRNQAGISMGVPIFHPQGWARSRSAYLSLSAARSERIDRGASLSFDAGSAWVDYVTTLQRLEIARARTAASRRSFEGVGVRSASGDLTRIDLRQAESALLAAQAAEAPLRADSTAAAEAIYLVCGAYPASAVRFPDTLLDLPDPPSGLRREATDVATARLLKESAASNERAELFGCLPTVRLSGSSAYATDDILGYDGWDHRAELRISLPIPPATDAVGAARASRRIAESRYAAALRSSGSRLRIAEDNYRQNRIALGLWLSDSAAASEVATGREASFLAGSATISEFLAAQKDLYAACDALWIARRNLALSGLALLKELGSLPTDAEVAP